MYIFLIIFGYRSIVIWWFFKQYRCDWNSGEQTRLKEVVKCCRTLPVKLWASAWRFFQFLGHILIALSSIIQERERYQWRSISCFLCWWFLLSVSDLFWWLICNCLWNASVRMDNKEMCFIEIKFTNDGWRNLFANMICKVVRKMVFINICYIYSFNAEKSSTFYSVSDEEKEWRQIRFLKFGSLFMFKVSDDIPLAKSLLICLIGFCFLFRFTFDTLVDM